MIRTAIALVLLAAPANALSCLSADAVRLYEMARDASDPYYIVRGRIDLTDPFTPPDPETGEATRTAASISGNALTEFTFSTSVEAPISIETSCLGPWCGSVDGLSGEVFAALRVADDGTRLVLRVGPCGGDVVPWSKDGEARLLTCHRSGVCETGSR